MKPLILVLAVMWWAASDAWSQVIFLPPEQPVPAKHRIEPRVRQLLDALHRPRAVIFIHIGTDRPCMPARGEQPAARPEACSSAPSPVMEVPAGPELFFRKKEVLEQAEQPPADCCGLAVTPEQPARAHPVGNVKPGQIQIIPWRAGASDSYGR